MTVRIHALGAPIVVAAMLASMTSAGPARGGDEVGDAWITVKTKMALLTREGADTLAVDVDTVDGRVALHGRVATAEQKERAGETAASIEGVRKVHNLLQVAPEMRQPAVPARDEQIAERVAAALGAESSLPAGGVEVRSVEDGVVVLGGELPRMTQHLQAVETASGVEGVRRVESRIASPDRLVDAEIWSERIAGEAERIAVATEAAAERLGGAARDLWITSAVKMRLLADERTPGLDVNVDTRDGEVTLFGMVGTDSAKRAAEENALAVEGVTAVHNELRVVREASQPPLAGEDEVVAEAINEALANRPALDDGDIVVRVDDGVARLTGTVPSQQDRLLAAVTARRAPGVRAVTADLQVAE